MTTGKCRWWERVSSLYVLSLYIGKCSMAVNCWCIFSWNATETDMFR